MIKIVKEGLPSYSKTKDKYFRFKFYISLQKDKALDADKTYPIIEMVDTSPANQKGLGKRYVLLDTKNMIPTTISKGDRLSRMQNSNMSYREIYEVVNFIKGSEIEEYRTMRIADVVNVQYDGKDPVPANDGKLFSYNWTKSVEGKVKTRGRKWYEDYFVVENRVLCTDGKNVYYFVQAKRNGTYGVVKALINNDTGKLEYEVNHFKDDKDFLTQFEIAAKFIYNEMKTVLQSK